MTKFSGEQGLENTYNLASAADVVDYYRSFAASYDTGFAQEMGYHYPKAIAEAYQKHPTAPVADIGCPIAFAPENLQANAFLRQGDGVRIPTEGSRSFSGVSTVAWAKVGLAVMRTKRPFTRRQLARMPKKLFCHSSAGQRLRIGA